MDEQEIPNEEKTEAAPEAPKKSLFKNPLFIGGIVLILSGLGVGGYFIFSKKEAPAIPGKEQKIEKVADGKEKNIDDKVFYFDFPDMLVNIISNSKKGNYLKISISIEFSDSNILEKVKLLKPRLLDQYQVFLRSLRSEDLQGSAGMERIREELLRRTNLVTHPIKVNDILFRELVVQ